MKDSNKLISVLVPVVSVLLAFAIGCVVMAALGANPLGGAPIPMDRRLW